MQRPRSASNAICVGIPSLHRELSRTNSPEVPQPSRGAVWPLPTRSGGASHARRVSRPHVPILSGSLLPPVIGNVTDGASTIAVASSMVAAASVAAASANEARSFVAPRAYESSTLLGILGADALDMQTSSLDNSDSVLTPVAPPPRIRPDDSGRLAKTLESLLGRVSSMESMMQQHEASIATLQEENRELKKYMLESALAKVKAHSRPVSMTARSAIECSPRANLLTVVQLEGFEHQIAESISPCTGNRRFAGKVGWNKLQKTCRALRAVVVPLEMDPSVRIVPDNFSTIRRAIQNIDKSDRIDRATIIVRHRAVPYTEQIVIDRRVALQADPSASEAPVIHGRITIGEGSDGTVVKGFAVSNNNPRDPWGSAIHINGARNVVIENCELSSSANDETVLKLCSCEAIVRKNFIQGGQTHGVIGISIEGRTRATVSENTITNNSTGVYLNPTATVKLKNNHIERNHRGVQINEEDIETIVHEGGFGQIMLKKNLFKDNRDGQDDETFSKSLELFLHPMLRRHSKESTASSFTAELSTKDYGSDPGNDTIGDV